MTNEEVDGLALAELQAPGPDTLGAMKKLLIVTGVLAVVGHFAWRWWLQSNAASAKAWAEGTDRVG